MVAVQPLISGFEVVGKLENILVSSKGRVKHLDLSTAEGDYSIEVAKSLTTLPIKELQPGCRLKIAGMKKYEIHQDQLKYKAYSIELITPAHPVAPTTKASKSTAQILVCQGSSCRKQGSNACRLLRSELNAQGVGDQVDIKITGCLKQCKQAPNLIVMPGRNRYSRVRSAQIPNIVKRHFSN
ncbi:MAG: (2Fe-2S) ferredoxin domain-containing protein [Cyanobacteria bacterium P01_G01_bin.39]